MRAFVFLGVRAALQPRGKKRRLAEASGSNSRNFFANTPTEPSQMIRLSSQTLRASAAAIIAALALTGCGEEKTAASPEKTALIPVGVVQLVEHEALDATVKGFIDELAARGFKDGEKIRIDRQNAQGDRSPTSEAASYRPSPNSSLPPPRPRCRQWPGRRSRFPLLQPQ